MRIMMWMYCIEASAGIYKSTRLGGQGSLGYIWQSTIRISTTTKYTLIPCFWFLDFRKEMSVYYLEHADVNHIRKNFDDFEEEARSLLSLGLPIPAYV